jgi:integrase
MLTAKRVERTKTPGRYRCGLVKGLLLQITESGAKSWVLRYELNGRERMMGLGSAADFTFKEARERARAARQSLADKRDPLDARRAERAAAKAAAAKRMNFREAAPRYAAQQEAKWTNESHRLQFLASLETYAYPVLGNMDVATIDTPDALRVLEPIWTTKTETASRIRNRIERVLDWAVVCGHRPRGDNPCRWKGHLENVLPAPRAVAPIVPHKALHFTAVPAFMETLRQRQGTAARALEFTILTAARSGEVIGATWDEIDIVNAMWIVPGRRMKSGREHRVPLSGAAAELLHKLPREDGNPFVFIGTQPGRGLYFMAMSRLLKTIGCDATVHGFRSCFSTWAHERSSFTSHAIEISLAHAVGTDVERSYRRSDLAHKRAQLMKTWAAYCTNPPVEQSGAVVPMRR